VPAIIDGSGIHGLSMGNLPKPIAILCNIQIAIQELAIEAAVTGSREKALQALSIDPIVQSIKVAEVILDELLKVHIDYLPQFRV